MTKNMHMSVLTLEILSLRISSDRGAQRCHSLFGSLGISCQCSSRLNENIGRPGHGLGS